MSTVGNLKTVSDEDQSGVAQIEAAGVSTREIGDASFGRLALGAVLVVAAAVRLWNILAHTYVVFPDETFQYLEEAHRLAFGSGVVTWEYIEGIRSWLLPGILATIMRATSAIDGRALAYVYVIRILCGALSLIVPLLAFTQVRRRYGLAAALAAGGICALWYDLVYYSPAILTEVLATHCALLAYLVGGPADSSLASRRAFGAGLLYGLAACLRFQYAPTIALLALMQSHRDRRVLLQTTLGAGMVVVAVLGGLDWVTWGAPFQSVWLNYRRNVTDGIAAAMGTDSWYYPFAFFLADWGPLAPVLVGLAALGARQAVGLAMAAAVTLLLHALSPHKEVRFIYFTIAVAAILIGLGLAEALRRLRLRPAAAYAVALIAATLLVAGEALTASSGGSAPDAWHRDAAALKAFVRAGELPELCGVAVRSLPIARTGGYTYLHRNVPLYVENSTMRVSGLPEPLPLRVELNRASVPQFADAELAQQIDRFNALVAAPEDAMPGFARRVCFGAGRPGDAKLCVFERPGECRTKPP